MSDRGIQLLLNDELIAVAEPPPTQTLLQFIREDRGLCGTKEGCAEGDCGACTVVVADCQQAPVRVRALNACIQFLPALDGCAVYTVEYLRQRDQSLHPVQAAMVACHGSQCGFCTPGFIMSLWAVYIQQQLSAQREDGHNALPTVDELRQALSGNLCRCTGYKPILAAGQAMFAEPTVPYLAAEVAAQLQTQQRPHSLQAPGFFAPRQLNELLRLKAEHPQATVLAGGTDVGLWVTKQLRSITPIIYLGKVVELQQLTQTGEYLEIGAAVTLSDAYAALADWYPVAELAERFASVPIRNVGTLVGNLANGSPIGDSAPWLIAAGADVVLASTAGQRTLPLADLYIGYQQQARTDTEILMAVRVPKPKASAQLRTWKVCKRHDSDISAVCGAFYIELDDDNINAVRIAYGGMAATVKRALQCEQALLGQPLTEAVVRQGMAALAQDYAPLSDMRASAQYRQTVAANLLYRFFCEVTPRNDTGSGRIHLNVREEQSA